MSSLRQATVSQKATRHPHLAWFVASSTHLRDVCATLPHPTVCGCLSQIDYYYRLMARLPAPRTVCEIGYNAGHSAHVWLSARPDMQTKLVAFDLASHPYTTISQRHMDALYVLLLSLLWWGALSHVLLMYRFPGRLELIAGDSLETVPAYAAEHPETQCDIVVCYAACACT